MLLAPMIPDKHNVACQSRVAGCCPPRVRIFFGFTYSRALPASFPSHAQLWLGVGKPQRPIEHVCVGNLMSSILPKLSLPILFAGAQLVTEGTQTAVTILYVSSYLG